MKDLHGFDIGFSDGGNYFMSTAYLARWSGPVNESDDPYNPSSPDSPSNLLPKQHVQQVLFIPDRSSPTDTNDIKQAIVTYGAVATTMMWSSDSYNWSTAAYYFGYDSWCNHAISIVGWNDSYSKDNFITPPPGDGAFIVRNSWGPDWGDAGYFYVSYYDSNLGKDSAVFVKPEATSNYSSIYQYDSFGWVASAGYMTETAWGANVFEARSNEQLDAVSFYSVSPNSSYTLYIYKDPSDGPINTIGPVESQTGTCSYGYVTIKLDQPVTLPPGHRYSVVVQFYTPGYGFPIPVEYPVQGYSSTAAGNPGESYISSDGGYWLDTADWVSSSNVCIKAFTNECKCPTNVSLSPDSGSLPIGSPVKLKSTYSDADGYASIGECELKINASDDESRRGQVKYDAAQNKLYMLDSAGTNWLGGYAPGSSNTIDNGLCRLDCANTSVSGKGNELVVTWSMSFESGMYGKNCDAWMFVSDTSNVSSSWDRMAEFSIISKSPTNISIVPSTGRLPVGNQLFLTCQYADPDGYADIGSAYLLINSSLTWIDSPYVKYDNTVNKLYVRSDDNGSWSAGYAPGSSAVLENSHCKLYCADTTVEKTGSTLTIKWAIEFKTTMGGEACTAYMKVIDCEDLFDGWDSMGSFTMDEFHVPENWSLSPKSGDLSIDAKMLIVSQYMDQDGYDDIRRSYLLINTVNDGANAVYLKYDLVENKLYVRDDADSAWLGGYAPGSSNIIENSSCKLYCDETSVSGSDTVQTISWKVLIKARMAGMSCGAWMIVSDKENLKSDWEQMGSYTVGSTSMPPVVLSLSPTSGELKTDSIVDFTSQYSDPNGCTNLQWSYLLLNTSLSGVNAVYLKYDAVQNKLYIRDDIDSQWLGGYAPGSANVIEGTLCKLYCDGTTVDSSECTQTIHWKVSLKSLAQGKAYEGWLTVIDKDSLRDLWRHMGDFSVANDTSTYSSIATGDLDNDGKADMTALRPDGTIWYTTDEGAWTNIPGHLSIIAADDVNGDGKADVVGIASDRTIWYSTDKTKWTSIPGHLASLSLGDLNGDGKADIAGLASDNTIWYTTDRRNWTRVAGHLSKLTLGDFDNNGTADIAGVASDNTIWLTKNKQTWTRIPGKLISLVSADLNGDKKTDIAGIASDHTVWRTTNLSTWAKIGPLMASLVTGDFDGDGKSDLAGISTDGSVYYTLDKVTWFKITGDIKTLWAGDLNGDGKSDLAGIGVDGVVRYSTDLASWTDVH